MSSSMVRKRAIALAITVAALAIAAPASAELLLGIVDNDVADPWGQHAVSTVRGW